jgi:hypothetical protein
MSSSLAEEKNQKIEWLDDKQARAFFDKQVQGILGITGEEFLARAEKGEYKEACDNPKILKLLMMIPESLCRGHK